MGYRAKRNLGEPGDCEQALRRGKGRKENSANRASGARYGSKKERKKEREPVDILSECRRLVIPDT